MQGQIFAHHEILSKNMVLLSLREHVGVFPAIPGGKITVGIGCQQYHILVQNCMLSMNLSLLLYLD